jgi:galactokinase
MSNMSGAMADNFGALFGRTAEVHACAHGRVNLIGEHTDYNGGFVLPMPIPQETTVELARRDDDLVRAFSRDVDRRGHAREPFAYRLGEEAKRENWIDYVQGVTVALREQGHEVEGFELRVESSVPIGSGLSSSAALEVSLLRGLRELFRIPIDDLEIALLGQRAENDFVGAPVGLMDQMSASLGRPGSALFIDTRSREYRLIPIPESIELCVINSGVTHAHGTSDYRVRRRECEEAAAHLGVRLLRELDATDLARTTTLPSPLSLRAKHVITENQRVLDALAALEAADPVRLGTLFFESHASMRDDFAVSVPEIDMLVEIARGMKDVYGARLTGGGFGGSIVVLARAGTSVPVAHAIVSHYNARSSAKASVLVPALEA